MSAMNEISTNENHRKRQFAETLKQAQLNFLRSSSSKQAEAPTRSGPHHGGGGGMSTMDHSYLGSTALSAMSDNTTQHMISSGDGGFPSSHNSSAIQPVASGPYKPKTDISSSMLVDGVNRTPPDTTLSTIADVSALHPMSTLEGGAKQPDPRVTIVDPKNKNGSGEEVGDVVDEEEQALLVKVASLRAEVFHLSQELLRVYPEEVFSDVLEGDPQAEQLISGGAAKGERVDPLVVAQNEELLGQLDSESYMLTKYKAHSACTRRHNDPWSMGKQSSDDCLLPSERLAAMLRASRTDELDQLQIEHRAQALDNKVNFLARAHQSQIEQATAVGSGQVIVQKPLEGALSGPTGQGGRKSTTLHPGSTASKKEHMDAIRAQVMLSYVAHAASTIQRSAVKASTSMPGVDHTTTTTGGFSTDMSVGGLGSVVINPSPHGSAVVAGDPGAGSVFHMGPNGQLVAPLVSVQGHHQNTTRSPDDLSSIVHASAKRHSQQSKASHRSTSPPRAESAGSKGSSGSQSRQGGGKHSKQVSMQLDATAVSTPDDDFHGFTGAGNAKFAGAGGASARKQQTHSRQATDQSVQDTSRTSTRKIAAHSAAMDSNDSGDEPLMNAKPGTHTRTRSNQSNQQDQSQQHNTSRQSSHQAEEQEEQGREVAGEGDRNSNSSSSGNSSSSDDAAPRRQPGMGWGGEMDAADQTDTTARGGNNNTTVTAIPAPGEGSDSDDDHLPRMGPGHLRNDPPPKKNKGFFGCCTADNTAA